MKEVDKMYTLAFDTTAECCSVCLMKDNHLLGGYRKNMDFGQAEILLPQISAVLKQNSLSVKDLDLLAVCVGPGSFTGVRASIACARAFALAVPELNVTGVSSFEAYLHSLDDSELSEINAVIIETKRNDFYFQSFNGKREKLCEPQAMEYGDIIDLLKGHVVTLIGDGVERFLDKPSGLTIHTVRLEKSLSVQDLAECAIQKFAAQKLNYPKPLYLRAPDVCVKS